MPVFRVWLHDAVGQRMPCRDIEAASPREAAEIAHGGPLAAFGAIHRLRATVVQTGTLSKGSDTFFAKVAPATPGKIASY